MLKPLLLALHVSYFILVISKNISSESTIIPATSSAHNTISKILNGPTYSKDVRPFSNAMGIFTPQGNATAVKVNLLIRKIDRIDDLKMVFVSQFIFRQTWKDPRLKHENSNMDLEFVTLNDEMAGQIWTPDLFFMNEATSTVHNTIKVNSYTRVYPDGQIIWSTRLTVTFSCPMDLTYFPFDAQICSIQIADYSQPSKGVSLIWDEDDPVEFSESKNLGYSRFKLDHIKTGVSAVETGKSGRFGSIFVDFYLQRQATNYLLLIYTPTAMFVLLSWISFWLGHCISARLSLTLTLLLTMTTQIQGSQQNLPQVSYIKAIDVWSGFCIIIGAAAILESATVAFLMQNTKIFLKITSENEKDEKQDKIIRYNRHARLLDKISCIIFPLGFCGFVTLYVLVYVVGGRSINESTSRE